MIECETIPLKELCDIRIGRTPRRDTPKYWGGENVWVTVKELNNEIIIDSKEHITDIAVNEVMSDPVPAGTLLVSFKLSIGKMAVAGRPLFTNEAIAALVIRDEKHLNRDYLSYALSRVIHSAETSHAVKGKLLNKSKLEKLLIPVVPIGEQRRIVDILKRADSIRRLRKQAIDTARQLIPALFIEIFGDPAANPNGWIIKPLKEVADIGSGVTKGRKLDGHQTIELPYLAVSNVQDGHLNLTKIKSIQVKPAEIEKYQVLPGDFLMTEGGDPDKLGRGAIWNGEIDVCLHQNHIFKVRCNREILLPEYLRSLVSSHYGKGYFLRVAKQTTGIASINKTQLGKFPVLIPSIELQNDFLLKERDIMSIISQQESALEKAEMTFRSLLNTLFQAGPADWSSSSGQESLRSTTNA